MKINHIHDTKKVRMELTDNNGRKQAGSNNLTLTVNSDDWRLSSQTVSMTIREAKALKSFLNEHLS
jgi:hypothetical protein